MLTIAYFFVWIIRSSANEKLWLARGSKEPLIYFKFGTYIPSGIETFGQEYWDTPQTIHALFLGCTTHKLFSKQIIKAFSGIKYPANAFPFALFAGWFHVIVRWYVALDFTMNTLKFLNAISNQD